MGTLILNVVIVLGIIIAGGFLIFFLGDLLISIVDPKGEEERIKNKKKDSAKRFAKKVEKLPDEVQEELKENPEVLAILEQADAEEAPAEEQVVASVTEYKPEEEKKEEEEVKEPTEEERLAEARAALERRKAEILKRMQEQLAAEDEEDEDEEEEEEEPEEEAAVEETVEVQETPEEAKLRQELEQAKQALEAERQRTLNLEEQIKKANAEGAVAVKPVKSKDAYLADLAQLEARLRDNEKEFKACKREYLPLAKVNKTLANDEKKLRRKEAIVAKQKVILYGVNNYEDIDEEKAKKLAEELDLLDGLKLSVQHCREVMENNKERFPVLEKMYFILKAQNEQLRADILEVQEAIKNIEE